jgi:molybdate transport system substrate-binding protein
MSGVFRTALLAAAGTLTVCNTFGAEIKVMTAGAFRAALVALVPTFESATQHKVVIVATATGGAQSVPSRLQRGEAVDVVIVADALLEQFILEGKIAAGSRVALARSAIGW